MLCPQRKFFQEEARRSEALAVDFSSRRGAIPTESGRGTRLELTTLFGIVQQDQSSIQIRNQPEEDSIFHIPILLAMRRW